MKEEEEIDSIEIIQKWSVVIPIIYLLNIDVNNFYISNMISHQIFLDFYKI